MALFRPQPLRWNTPPSIFLDDFEEFVAVYTLNYAKLIFRYAVDGTPVDTGELRASWRLARDVPRSDTFGDPDKAERTAPGQPPVPRPRVPPFRPRVGAIWHVSNYKRYAEYVEEGTPLMDGYHMLELAILKTDMMSADQIVGSTKYTGALLR